MADIKQAYGSSGQAITCTLASLANNAARQSTAIDNATNKFLDALVTVKIKSGASGVTSTGYVNIYAYGTVDAGTTYGDGLSGTDGAATLANPTNLRLLGILSVVANATTYTSNPFSIASIFGGVMPEKWGIVIENKTGAALDATEGSHAKLYQGIYSVTV